MAATAAGAIKAYVEGLGLGLSVYRDGAPKDAEGNIAAAYPHAVVQDGIATTPQAHGDYDDPTGHQATTELVQVDLYQLARRLDPATQGRTVVAERYDLPDALAAALTGTGIQQHAPWRVYGTRVQSGQRWPVEDNVVRHTWTVAIERDTRRLTP